jgi:hypothetical protein
MLIISPKKAIILKKFPTQSTPKKRNLDSLIFCRVELPAIFVGWGLPHLY